MSGKIITNEDAFEIGGIENRIRFLLRPFKGHVLYEEVVNAILDEFKPEVENHQRNLLNRGEINDGA